MTHVSKWRAIWTALLCGDTAASPPRPKREEKLLGQFARAVLADAQAGDGAGHQGADAVRDFSPRGSGLAFSL
jgi:hypothetical protein